MISTMPGHVLTIKVHALMLTPFVLLVVDLSGQDCLTHLQVEMYDT